MIIFSALVPHPPIIVPNVGGDKSKKAKKTISAMKRLAQDLVQANPETLVIISPHGLVYADQINICGMERLIGSLSQFGYPALRMKFKNDIILAERIAEQGKKNGVKTLLYGNDDNYFELDHGIVVPLYFLTKNLPHIQVVPIAYSFQEKGLQFGFGETLGEVAEKSDRRVAIIASGDLSHRLIQTSPAGYSRAGKEFDRLLISHLKEKDTQGILEMDDEFVEEAGECGYRSLLILLGAIDKLDWQSKVLSYEGPFGVGYSVVNFKINSK
jgi:aromatic ring-opening dioxygenase LigB subunit